MSLLNNNHLRVFFAGRRRFQLAWVFAVILIVTTRDYPTGWLGISLCFAGALLRSWCSGYLRKEAKLSVGGPYRYTRNPLYLGTFLMWVGATASVHAWILAAIGGFVFFLNYHYVIENEERKLPSVFGQPYGLYCQLVPRFWPTLSPPSQDQLRQINPNPEGFRYSWDLAWKNKVQEAMVTFVGIELALAGIAFVRSSLQI